MPDEPTPDQPEEGNVIDLPQSEVSDDTLPQPEAPDAVLILKITNEEGDIRTEVTALGGVQPTEIATLIELGLASWRAKLGLK